MMNGTDAFNVCAIQMDPLFGQKQRNLERSCQLILEAAAQGAKLIVLPELCNTGYMFQSRSELYRLAESIPEGPSVLQWAALAQELDVYIAAGIAELGADGVRCYNSAVLMGPNGYIGHYRKLHLWADEKLFFEPGDGGYPLFHTPICRIGLLVCYDMWFPESFRILALQGADVICCCSDWINHATANPSTMGVIQAMAGASSNHLFVAASSRTGTERGVTFAGQSMLAGPNGRLLSGPLDSAQEGFVIAPIEHSAARRINSGTLNAAFHDRRIDVYDAMLGAQKRVLPR